MVNNTNFIPRLKKYADKLGNLEVEKPMQVGLWILAT